MLLGATDGILTVTNCVAPAVFAVQGVVVLSILTQYVVELLGDIDKVDAVAKAIGFVPTTAPVPH